MSSCHVKDNPFFFLQNFSFKHRFRFLNQTTWSSQRSEFFYTTRACLGREMKKKENSLLFLSRFQKLMIQKFGWPKFKPNVITGAWVKDHWHPPPLFVLFLSCFLPIFFGIFITGSHLLKVRRVLNLCIVHLHVDNAILTLSRLFSLFWYLFVIN